MGRDRDDAPGLSTAAWRAKFASTEAHCFTAAELAREAEREVTMRETVYANRVAAGKMKPQDAELKIAKMREIARRLRLEEEQERLL